MHKIAKSHISVYLALVCWGAMAFTAAPNFSSFLVHFFISPIMLVGVIIIARFEGANAKN